jgi:hypothetical protein
MRKSSHHAFTILIQGPLNEISLSMIPHYQQYGEVVISCWEDDDLNLIPNHIRYIAKPLPDRESKDICCICPRSTWYWAVNSQRNGAQIIETPYFIKTRSDERFLKLDPFIDTLLKNPNKLVYGNIFARRWEDIAYHIGDHIYAAKTSTMQTALSFLADTYNNSTPSPPEWLLETHFDENNTVTQRGFCAEQILAYSFLYASDPSLFEKWDICEKKTMLHYFEVVDINLTEEFLTQWKKHSIQFVDKFNNLYGVFDQNDLIQDINPEWFPRTQDWKSMNITDEDWLADNSEFDAEKDVWYIDQKDEV